MDGSCRVANGSPSGKVPSRGTSTGSAAEDLEAAHDEHFYGLTKPKLTVHAAGSRVSTVSVVVDDIVFGERRSTRITL